MSPFHRFTLAVAIVFLALAAAQDVSACPNCKYSPYHWGFCHYYFPAGYDNCETYVVDNFSGRTDCQFRGAECRWYSDGSGGTLPGPYYADPEDYGLLAPASRGAATAIAIAGPRCSSWADTPNDRLLVF